MSRRIDKLLETIRMRPIDAAWGAVAAREFEANVQRLAARDHAHLLRVLAASEQTKARAYQRAGNEEERNKHLERAHALRHASDTVAHWQPTPLRRSSDRSRPLEESPPDGEAEAEDGQQGTPGSETT